MIQYIKHVHRNLKDLTEPDVTYALAQSRGTKSIDDLAAHMASHNTPFTKGTIKAILTDFVGCTRELMLDGYIVKIGDLGTFGVSLKSNGVMESKVDSETGEKPVFSASDITAVNCKFTPGKDFEDMISDATFELTITKAQQAAQKAANQTKIEAGTYLDQEASSSSDTGGSTQHD